MLSYSSQNESLDHATRLENQIRSLPTILAVPLTSVPFTFNKEQTLADPSPAPVTELKKTIFHNDYLSAITAQQQRPQLTLNKNSSHSQAVFLDPQ